MSANIGVNKLKFSVFGKGFDDTRNDSGDGYAETVDNYALGVHSGAIDNTGEFVWFGVSGGLLKRRVDDMSNVSQSVYTSWGDTMVFHPLNVANNYGLVTTTNDEFVIFDLTDDTIIQSGTQANLSLLNYKSCDCILVGSKIYVVNYATEQKWDIILGWFDVSDGSSYCDYFEGQKACGGFMDNSSIMIEYVPTWFSDYKQLFSYGFNGVRKWEIMATEGGGDGFPNVVYTGFSGNGKLYLPTKIGGKWRMGEYSSSHAPSINGTPHPLRVFGQFDSKPSFLWKWNQRFGCTFSDERHDVAFLTNIGLFWSDMKDVIKLTTDQEIPLAMNDKVLLTTDYAYGHVRKFTYR